MPWSPCGASPSAVRKAKSAYPAAGRRAAGPRGGMCLSRDETRDTPRRPNVRLQHCLTHVLTSIPACARIILQDVTAEWTRKEVIWADVGHRSGKLLVVASRVS